MRRNGDGQASRRARTQTRSHPTSAGWAVDGIEWADQGGPDTVYDD